MTNTHKLLVHRHSANANVADRHSYKLNSATNFSESFEVNMIRQNQAELLRHTVTFIDLFHQVFLI